MAEYLPNCRQVAEQIGARYGLPPGLLYSQIYQESGCRVDAVGPTTKYGRAVGIAQIISSFHPGVNPRDPIESINYLAQWLSSHYQQYKNSWALAVASWHAGEPAVNKSQPCVPGTYDKAAGIGTLAYVRSILSRAGISFDADKTCAGLTNPTNNPTSNPPILPFPTSSPRPTNPGIPRPGTFPVEENQFRVYLILGVTMLLIIFAVSRLK